ncbi:60S ribosomal protein L34, partial [Tetrabaena socialis]
MAQRLTYRRRHSYHTKSNAVRIVKTPGGRLVYQYKRKQESHPKCAISGVRLHGFKATPHTQLHTLPKRAKSVNRIYGGCLSHKVVKERIIRAFLIEEQKIVK